ncbi:MAG: DnaJ C-terminal domain-containing protein [Opitutales bacterium]
MNRQPSTLFAASDFYECLQVTRDASASEVTRAFRQLAKQYHPDLAPKWVSGGALFHRLRQAYETLSNPVKRQVYDETLARQQSLRRPGSGAKARSSAGFSSPQARATSRPASANFAHAADFDLSARISIPWEKGLAGGLQKVRLQAPNHSKQPLRANFVVVQVPKNCPEGHQVQVPFYGRVERARMRAGHLNIRIEYRRDNRFKPLGGNLHTVCELDPWDAALGGRFSVDSPVGPLSFQVPAGTRHLHSLRVPGLGLPRQGGHRGDVVVCIKIRARAAETAEQKRLWAALKQAHR